MRARTALATFALLGGCSAADRTSHVDARDPLARLAGTSAEIAQLIGRAVARPSGRQLASQSTRLARAIHATVPADAGDELRVAVDDWAGEVRVRTEGVAGTAAVEGRAIVHAAPKTTVAHFATATAIEQLVRVEAQRTIAWSLAVPAGATLRRLDDGHGGTIEIVARDGVPRMRMTADRAWDGAGRAVPVTLSLEGMRVVAKLPRDVAYPVVIDPAWSSTTTPVRLRNGHTATVLGDGRVLIAGGDGTSSAETFDTVTGRFRPTGSMSVARGDAAATLMGDGRVLVVGGGNSSAEIYDPSSGSFTATGSATVARSRGGATLLPSGKVLVGGGSTAVAELFDPATGTFTAISGKGAGKGRPTRLTTGKIFFLGVGESEVYDPAAGTFSKYTTPSDVNEGVQAYALRDGRALIYGVTGAGSSGGPTYYTTVAYITNPATGATVTTAQMGLPPGLHPVLLPSGKIMHFGDAGAEVWDPASGAWTTLATPPAGHESATLSQLPNGDVLVVGGSAGSVDLFTAQDPGGAATFATGGGIARSRFDARATLLLDGRVFVAGGDAAISADPSATYEVYDPATNTFGGVKSLVAARRHQGQVLLANGKVLVAGGGPSTAELFDPSAGTSTATGSMSVARGAPGAVRLANGTVLVAGGGTSTAELYDPATGTFTATGSMTAPRGNTTAILLASGKVLVTDGSTSDLYDPQSKTFVAAAAPIAAGRDPNVAVLMLGGDVLLGGGATTAFDRFDPTASSSSLTAEVPEVSFYRAATALPFGRVLVAGGMIGTEYVRGTALAFDAVGGGGKGDFAPLGNLAIPTYKGTATWLPSGGALIAGGAPCVICAWIDPLATSVYQDRALDAWRPTITTSPTSVAAGATFSIAGARLTGVVHSATGANAPNPIALWIPASTQGQVVGRVTKFSATSADVTLPGTALHGPGFLLVSVDGITSRAVPLTLTPAAQATSCAFGAECTSGFCVDGVCCDTACNGTCQACTAARKGSGADGTCGAIPPGKDPKDACASFQGAPCTDGAECATGRCVDGVCCDTACTGQCEACNVEGSTGVCVPVLGTPHGSRTPCDAGDGVCSTKLCDGSARDTCAGFAPTTTSCRMASCTSGVATSAASCDGKGACPAAATSSCEPFACGDSACLTKCSVDAECAPSYRCSEGKCVTGAFCDGDHTVQIPGGAPTDCTPYRCEGDHCKNTCGSSADCVGGYLCNGGACVSASVPAVEDSGGCGFGVKGSAGPGGVALLALASAIALSRRRRTN